MLSEKMQNKFFDKARHVSYLSDYRREHIGCVIVYKGYIISEGYNTSKTNPIQKHYNKYRNFTTEDWRSGSLHAEISALIKCKDMEDIDWSKVSIFTYRENKNHRKAKSFCCPACKQALIDRGIKNIYFTVDDGIGYVKLD